jgi:hypothetical protein
MSKLEEYQARQMDIATSQLIAHGAMLFAVLSGLFSLMRVIINHIGIYLPTFSRLGYFILLFMMFIAVSYVVGRLFYWAQMLNVSIYVNQLDKKQKTNAEKSFQNFYNEINNKTIENTQNKEELHLAKIFSIPKFSLIYFENHFLISLVLSIFIGSILEIVRVRLSSATLCGFLLFYITNKIDDIEWSSLNSITSGLIEQIK